MNIKDKSIYNKKYFNQLKLSKDLNLNVSHVNACLLNKRPRHKNLYFHVVEVVK